MPRSKTAIYFSFSRQVRFARPPISRRSASCIEATPEAGAIVSVVRHDSPHPNKIVTIGGGYVKSYLGTNPSVPRQSLPVVHSINGAFYIVPRQVVVEQRTFLPERTLAFEMPPERSVNLDGPIDLLLYGSAFETASAGPKPLLSRPVGIAANAAVIGSETSRTCERPRTYRGSHRSLGVAAPEVGH